ncbi:cytochrome b [Qipengyuania profunda]|uniref:cytochrome b n=1 Tax=Qipengyuania profunda TaxID=3113984 RepID=UPI002A18DBDA|nr:cytochrome b [Qipengyuania sp. HL-TH1]WPL55457.1 cytochrome b [Qipengyuania sp. HL-TH5]
MSNSVLDNPDRYGAVSRSLHWGMAVLFLIQFCSAAAHWGLPRENALREMLWGYHTDVGLTLFLLVFLRGAWGLANMSRRPTHPGALGRAAMAGHLAIYALMIIVPSVRVLAAAGGTRGLSFWGIEVLQPRGQEVTWMQIPAEWHGEMGWLLAALILGHAGIALFWHGSIKRDGTLQRMVG